VAVNKYRLTPRELEILAAIEQGSSDREIAESFRISEDTVRHHLRNTFAKLGVRGRWSLAIRQRGGLWGAVRRRAGQMDTYDWVRALLLPVIVLTGILLEVVIRNWR